MANKVTQKIMLENVVNEIAKQIKDIYYNNDKNIWSDSIKVDLTEYYNCIDTNDTAEQISCYYYIRNNNLSTQHKCEVLYPLAEDILSKIDLTSVSKFKPYIKLVIVSILRLYYFKTYRNISPNNDKHIYTKINKIFKRVGYDNLTNHPMLSHYFPCKVDKNFIEKVDDYLYYYDKIHNTRKPPKPYLYIKDGKTATTNNFLEYQDYANELSKEMHKSISKALLICSTSKEEFLSLYRKYTPQFKIRH